MEALDLKGERGLPQPRSDGAVPGCGWPEIWRKYSLQPRFKLICSQFFNLKLRDCYGTNL
jgi:hypothetical protein